MSEKTPETPFYDPTKLNGGRPMSPSQLAERWDCSLSSVTALCAQGKLRHFRIGKMYRIPADAIIEYEMGQYGSAALSPATIQESRGKPEKQLDAIRDAKQDLDKQAKERNERINQITREIRMQSRWSKTPHK